jgi:xanthine dehydrogenase molybdopterin-binding subunit B
MLAISVWTAIKNAISFIDDRDLVSLRVPATQEQICRSLFPEAF